MIRQERAASRFSTQFRYPYLDDEIVRLSVNMPLHLKQNLEYFNQMRVWINWRRKINRKRHSSQIWIRKIAYQRKR